MALQAASSAPRAAGLARKACQLRRWRRRVIDVAGPAPQDGPAARTSATSTSRSPPGNCRKLFAQGRAEAMAGERRADEVLVCDHPLVGNYSSSNSAIQPQKPLPCMLYFLNGHLLCRPTRHRFLLLGGRFRPRVALEPTTGQLRLIGTVNLCRAGSPQPPNSPPYP